MEAKLMLTRRILAKRFVYAKCGTNGPGVKKPATTVPHIQSRASLLVIGLLTVIAGILLPTTVSAETSVLEVLQVGWDGQVVPGSWSPVRVRLTGGNSDVAGRVEVVSKARVQTGPQATPIEYAIAAYGQEVALPAGVAKEVTLWVPGIPAMGSNVGSPGSVRLVVNGGTVAEEKVEFRSAKTPLWPLIGVLADSPAIARALRQVELPVQGLPVPLSVASLAAADLPPSAERLSALSALAVQGNAAIALTGEQREALQQWVVAGGHLLVSGGPDAPRAASVLPDGALPVTFSGADGSADLSPLGVWADFKGRALATGPAVRFRPEKGSPLAGSSNFPLAWRIGLGQGTITLLAADPGLEPLMDWPGTPALLRKGLEPALPATGEINEKLQYIQMQQRNPSILLQGAVQALPPEAFPGWQIMALLLGGFVLVVGPGLHLVLWRVDRRIWSWAIVPVAALLVAGGMYYLGVGRDGRDVLVNVVSHVRLDPNGEQAMQAVIAGFFAPTHSTLTVDVPGDIPVQPSTNTGFQPYSTFGGPAASGSTEPPFHVVAGRDTRVEFNSGQWGVRSLAISRLLDNTGRITAKLQIEEGLIKGTVRNDTPYLLEDAGVLVGQSAAKLGSLAPGQTASVALDPGPPAAAFGNRYPISWRLFGKPRGARTSGTAGVAIAVPAPPPPLAASSTMRYYGGPGGMPEQYEVSQDPEVQRRIRLMDSIVNIPQPGPNSQSMPLTFLAFTRASVGERLPAAGSHPTFYLTLLDQPLSLDLPPGRFTIPPAMIPAEVVSQGGGFGGGSNGTIGWIQIQGSSMVYQFRPPLPITSKVDALVIGTRQMGQSTSFSPGKGMATPPPSAIPLPAEAGVFSIYDWQSATWEQLPGGAEEVRLQPAPAYVGSDGSVKLQVSSGPDRVVMFLQPELTVEGTVSK
ncbi:MAG: hypothetical protein HYY30_11625 [Chloroflexi bacterium]|nr:hypothetical protein [Chloroflexota bacterium]